MFFHRCGNTDFKVCRKRIAIKQSECGSILYTKGKLYHCLYHKNYLCMLNRVKIFSKFLNLDRISTAIPIAISNDSQAEDNKLSKEEINNKEKEKKKFNGRYIHI